MEPDVYLALHFRPVPSSASFPRDYYELRWEAAFIAVDVLMLAACWRMLVRVRLYQATEILRHASFGIVMLANIAITIDVLINLIAPGTFVAVAWWVQWGCIIALLAWGQASAWWTSRGAHAFLGL